MGMMRDKIPPKERVGESREQIVFETIINVFVFEAIICGFLILLTL